MSPFELDLEEIRAVVRDILDEEARREPRRDPVKSSLVNVLLVEFRRCYEEWYEESDRQCTIAGAARECLTWSWSNGEDVLYARRVLARIANNPELDIPKEQE